MNAQNSNHRFRVCTFSFSNKVALICITENWRHDEVANVEIFPGWRYHVIMQRDRLIRAHCGVLIAAFKDLKTYVLHSFSDICCSINFNHHNFHYSCLLIFNPSNISPHEKDSAVQVKAVYHHCDRKLPKKVANLCDMNIPDVCWNSPTAISEFSNKLLLTALDELELIHGVEQHYYRVTFMI